MPIRDFINGPAFHFWQAWQPAILALGAALIVRFSAGKMGNANMALQAPSIGALVGWFFLTFESMKWPPNLYSRLTILGGVAAIVGLMAPSLVKLSHGLIVILALFASWLLLGAPIRWHELNAILAQAAILGALSGVTMLWLRNANAWTIVCAAVALWINLWLAGAPTFWQLAAASVAVSSFALLGRGGSGFDEIGVASTIAFFAVIADLSLGKLRQDGFTIMDVACCSPLLTGFAAPRVAQKDIVLGSVSGAAGSVVLMWAVKTFG